MLLKICSKEARMTIDYLAALPSFSWLAALVGLEN